MQIVDYEGIGGNLVQNVDDAEFIIQVPEPKKRGKNYDIKELKEKVPKILNYYKDNKE